MRSITMESSGEPGSGHIPQQSSPTKRKRLEIMDGDSDDFFNADNSASSDGFEGRNLKELMGVISYLRRANIEASDLPLPKICVVGDQSTGKSSLIEGISEIKVPRSAGACTRCPIEINLVKTEAGSSWKCDVILTMQFIYGHQSKAQAPTGPRPFGPWIEQETPDEIHFASLDSKIDVLDALECAQLAILNPGKDPRQYRPGQNHEMSRSTQVEFSPNVIRLDISSPDVLNLSFYDLPGRISQDRDKNVPKLIENLMKRYIGPESTIILHTQTMNTDAANSLAAATITQMKAQDRTVGVLTKPDLCDASRDPKAIRPWLDILEGRMFPRKLGYFVVRNNTETPSDQIFDERSFFETTAPFSRDLSHHSHRFGTVNLKSFLSEILEKKIRECLPAIRKKIGAKLGAVEEMLKHYPKPVEGNVTLQIYSELQQFRHALAKEFEGGSLENSFFNEWHKEAKHLRNLILCSQPLLRMVPTPPVNANGAAAQSRAESIGGDSFMTSASPVRQQPETVIIDSDDEQSSQPIKAKAAVPTHRKLTKEINGLMKTYGEEARKYRIMFHKEHIREKIDSVNTGLPGSRDRKVVENMFEESIRNWPIILDQFLSKTLALLDNLIHRNIQNVFGSYEQTDLYKVLTESWSNFLGEAFEQQKEFAYALLAMEKGKVLTFDEIKMAEYEEEVLEILLERSRLCRRSQARAFIDQHNQDPEKTRYTEAQARAFIESACSGPDPYLAECREMATTRSYYYCAAGRFSEYLSLSIRSQIFKKCRDELTKAIVSDLGLNRDDAIEHCRTLLDVPRPVREEREKLNRDAQALEKALRRVDRLFSKGGVAAFALTDASQETLQQQEEPMPIRSSTSAPGNTQPRTPKRPRVTNLNDIMDVVE